MKRESRRALFAAISCAVVCGCASHRSAVDEAEPPPAAVPAAAEASSAAALPVATDPAIETVWAYLADRYDADGDGAISEAEYARDAAQFSRWDRDGDGELSAADFERSSSRDGGSGRGNGMSMGMARRTLARYFQTDDDAGLLPLSEANEAFALYDGSDGSAADGRLTEGEFTCSMDERFQAVPGDESPMVRRAMEDAEPWPTLLAGIDGDGNGELTPTEIGAFYTDVMRTETIDYSEWSERGAPRRQPAADAGGDQLAAQQGQPAPDFTLASPDGETTYKLTDFRGDRPVALIFGSYT